MSTSVQYTDIQERALTSSSQQPLPQNTVANGRIGCSGSVALIMAGYQAWESLQLKLVLNTSRGPMGKECTWLKTYER
ncbi:uncharacterized protein PITG_17611 [Phytophthora infestans T30-4]|uniref:Uncharacterized protein n=1 Tax=Phytophthora infestans (strain T30-4) TaxID=403677 RepID=D0NWT3_PHYIT|nr:uncharacterized protein PITG_17611 [Phytophthora infestans T30-4]EEY67516.1 hypothetical protein PITG_17611 [Phytophthora infestans T30-4]|eukprot:XP_002896489.1 hypothetical protein PITG_17611 [Phytophthora infestans T30-4]